MFKISSSLSLLLILTGIYTSGYSQNINAFTDANNRLYQFKDGEFSQIYYQVTRDIQVGTNHLCFVDSKGDVYAYLGGEKSLVAQTHSEIINTDHLLFVRTATVLRIFDQGVVHLLSPNAIAWSVGDSLVLFQDMIGGYVRYYYQDVVHELSMVIGTYPILQGEVGSNVFVFKDNSGNHSVFWRGQFYELFNSNAPVKFASGQDVVAFNDPINNTFTAFDNGYIINLEQQFAKNYAAGDNFIYYKSAGDVHKVVREERVTELGIDLQIIQTTDSLVIYNEVGAFKVWYNEKIYQLFNTKVSDFQTDGGIIAYTNSVGGVSAFVRGKEIDITRTRVESFKLVGSTILLRFGPSAYSVWWNGKMYDF